MRFLVLSLLLLPTSIPAQDSHQGADWRVYATLDKDGKAYDTMYSVPDIVRSPDGVARVWTQAMYITTADMDRTVKDKQFLRTVAGRIKAGYAPPFSSVEKINSDQVARTIVVEEIANQRKVHPSMVDLGEIDCKNLRYRLLATRMYKKGILESSTDLPGEWMYISPETNVKSLATLVCDPKLTAPDNTPVPVELPPQLPQLPGR